MPEPDRASRSAKPVKEKRRKPAPASAANNAPLDEAEHTSSGFNKYWLTLAALLGIAAGGTTWFLSNYGPTGQVQPPATMPAARDPFTPLGALEDMVRRADAGFKVEAHPIQHKVVIGRDVLEMSVVSSKPGYLYLYRASSDGQRLALLFPDAQAQDNRVEANRGLRLPDASWHIDAKGPPGVDHFVVLVSPTPRDLKQMRTCVTSGACPSGYGAAFVHVEEVTR